MAQKPLPSNTPEGISTLFDWQLQEERQWDVACGNGSATGKFRAFARAVARVLIYRKWGKRFPDGRVHVTPSQLAEALGTSVDAMQKGFNCLESKTELSGIRKIREARPGPKGKKERREQEWELTCLIPPPPIMLQVFLDTATTISADNRSERSTPKSSQWLEQVDRPKRSTNPETTASSGHHSHKGSKETTSPHHPKPYMAPTTVGDDGVADGMREKKISVLQKKTPLAEAQVQLMKLIMALPFELQGGGATNAAAAVGETECKILLEAGEYFWAQEWKDLAVADTTPQALLYTRLTRKSLRTNMVQRAILSSEKRNRALAAGELPPGTLSADEAERAYQYARSLIPDDSDTGYLAAMSRERAAYEVLVVTAKALFPVEYAVVDKEVNELLRSRDVEEGSLSWGRMFKYQFRCLAPLHIPWLAAVMKGDTPSCTRQTPGSGPKSPPKVPLSGIRAGQPVNPYP